MFLRLLRCVPLVIVWLIASGPARSLPYGSLHALELPRPGESTDHADEYSAGVSHLARGDLAAAETAFRESIKRRPRDTDAMLGLAEIAFRRHKLDEAGRWIQRAIDAGPDNAHAQASYGRYLAVNKRHKEAEVALRKAAQLAPKLVQPRMDLGDLYATTFERPKEAAVLYRQTLEINPDHAGAHYALGIVSLKLGDVRTAQNELETAARLEATNPLPAVALAQLHMHRGAWDSALDWTGRAIKLQPGLVVAHEIRGDVLQAKGDYSKAADEYSAAAKLNPKSGESLLKLGMLHQKNQQTEQAVAAYLKAIGVDARQAHAYNNLAWIAVENKRELDKAEVWAMKAVEIAPREPQFLDTLGWVQRAKGEFAMAVKSLEKAGTLAPRDAAIQYRLGLVYLDQGNRKGAARALQKSIELSPNSPEAADAKRRLDGLASQTTR